MTDPAELANDNLNSWVDDDRGPVALYFKQHLKPVEGDGGVVFPPTYADIGYNIDELSDGSKVVAIDSVGSQANRIEPMFKRAPFSKLVPQIDILHGEQQTLSILDVSHRLGDALIRSARPEKEKDFDLGKEAEEAFKTFLETGSALKLAKLAPTSIVFGVWDSRNTMARLPRILQSVVRAWDIDKLRRSAQYIPSLDYAKEKILSEEEQQKEEGRTNSELAKRGYIHVPSSGTHGGVVVHGVIRRDVTVNLVALRRLEGEPETKNLRRYLLGLSLVAATEPLDPFLRQGCLLVPDTETESEFLLVDRRGDRLAVDLTAERALDYVTEMAAAFGVGENRCVRFSREHARQDLGRQTGKSKKN